MSRLEWRGRSVSLVFRMFSFYERLKIAKK